jgi:hypothetical protein
VRICPECQDPITEGRHKRHPECKRGAHARAEKARRDALKDQESFDPQNLPIGQTVIDYTVQGAASRPPMHETHRQPRHELVTDTEVVDYTKGGHPAPGLGRHLDLSRVPGHIRRDLVQAQTMARDLAAVDGEPELATWQEVQGLDDSRTVSFGRPASFYEQPTLTPSPYAQAILGQAVAVARPRPQRPNLAAPQKTPAIIN